MRDPSRSVVVALILTIIALAVTTTPGDANAFAIRTLDGSGNNLRHPAWGQAGTVYLRVAPTNYADGISSMPTGPSVRYVSNRIFNDVGQNIFSKDGITQWAWVWGQFLDHRGYLKGDLAARFLARVAQARSIADLAAAFPYQVFEVECGIQHFYAFYRLPVPVESVP